MFNQSPVIAYLIILIIEFVLLRIKIKPVRYFIYTLMVFIILSSLWLVVTIGWLSYLILFLIVYRIINLFRKIRDSSKNNYFDKLIITSNNRLIILQFFLLACLYVININHISFNYIISFLSIITLIIVVFINIITGKNIRSTKQTNVNVHYYDRELPTVSVLIPARNETDDLEECLLSLIESDYPKLEILVLDDCSQNKKTSDIIKNYANNGVRFLQGKIPPDDWLAKNYAYQQLYEEANGDILLFCGVDVRFSKYSIRSMIEIMLDQKFNMISLIPRNIYKNHMSIKSLIYQPSRYAFEVSLPRSYFNKPPVLSTCWLIYHKELSSCGQFMAVKHKVTPESYFAKKVWKKDHKYKLIRSNETIGLSSFKPPEEQFLTATRTYYSKLHRKIDLIGFVTLGYFLIFLSPLIFCLYSLIMFNILIFVISLTTILLLIILYNQLIYLTFDKFITKAIGLIFVTVVFDMIIYNLSMFKYEFGSVYWKERNICLPVMHIEATLPKIDR